MELENSWVDFTVTRGPIRGGNRNRIGLIVKVKAREDIEQFLSGLAGNNRASVDAYGENWSSVDGKPLEFYNGENRVDSNRIYTLDHIGHPPLIINERQALRNVGVVPDDIVNLAFLRLVGVSGENGVSVGIAGAYSGDYLRKLKLLLPGAVKQFLQDYVVPVTINLQVISKG